MPAFTFDPAKDIPDLSGKVIVITGGTSGIGRETILQLALHSPSKIVFTGRNELAAKALISELEASVPSSKDTIIFVPCDLSGLASVRNAADQILTLTSRLDILLLNAGIMAVPPSLSADGYEIQFAVNHLSHALLLKHLLPLLQRTADLPSTAAPRVIFTTSQAARPPLPPKDGITFSTLRTSQDSGILSFSPWRCYAQSKLANILYARALAEHYPSLAVASVHPGIGYTGLQNSMGWFDRVVMWTTKLEWQVSVAELAKNGLWAATVASREELGKGRYFEPVGVQGPLLGWMGDEGLKGKLWEWTEMELKEW